MYKIWKSIIWHYIKPYQEMLCLVKRAIPYIADLEDAHAREYALAIYSELNNLLGDEDKPEEL